MHSTSMSTTSGYSGTSSTALEEGRTASLSTPSLHRFLGACKSTMNQHAEYWQMHHGQPVASFVWRNSKEQSTHNSQRTTAHRQPQQHTLQAPHAVFARRQGTVQTSAILILIRHVRNATNRVTIRMFAALVATRNRKKRSVRKTWRKLTSSLAKQRKRNFLKVRVGVR